MAKEGLSSSGHKFGQLIGDWWEQYVVLKLLQQVANKLQLFLDSRFVNRTCRKRGNKIHWVDVDGNIVDYDFVLELNGSSNSVGIPVGFVESFWRRGKRHSKDKARDDSGKLIPMRNFYPTTRFLGIVACGDFTEPARDFVINNKIELFYVPKAKIVEAFAQHNLVMDYSDSLPESEKLKLATKFESEFTDDKKNQVSKTLIDVVGKASFFSYISKIESNLTALPQEIRFIISQHSKPMIFRSVDEATGFLNSPVFSNEFERESYSYEITYSDGFEFSREIKNLDEDELKNLHNQLNQLSRHMEDLVIQSDLPAL